MDGAPSHCGAGAPREEVEGSRKGARGLAWPCATARGQKFVAKTIAVVACVAAGRALTVPAPSPVVPVVPVAPAAGSIQVAHIELEDQPQNQGTGYETRKDEENRELAVVAAAAATRIWVVAADGADNKHHSVDRTETAIVKTMVVGHRTCEVAVGAAASPQAPQ